MYKERIFTQPEIDLNKIKIIDLDISIRVYNCICSNLKKDENFKEKKDEDLTLQDLQNFLLKNFTEDSQKHKKGKEKFPLFIMRNFNLISREEFKCALWLKHLQINEDGTMCSNIKVY